MCENKSMYVQWNLANMNSREPSRNFISRNFTITVACRISVIMPGNFRVVCIKRFNSVHSNCISTNIEMVK